MSRIIKGIACVTGGYPFLQCFTSLQVFYLSLCSDLQSLFAGMLHIFTFVWILLCRVVCVSCTLRISPLMRTECSEFVQISLPSLPKLYPAFPCHSSPIAPTCLSLPAHCLGKPWTNPAASEQYPCHRLVRRSSSNGCF